MQATIKIKCADCGRHLAGLVREVVARKDVEIEIHACFHKNTWGKADYEQLQADNKRLKEEIKVYLGTVCSRCSHLTTVPKLNKP